MPPGKEGALCIKLPLPPGTLPTLWQDDDRFVSAYLEQFDGYYLTGDECHVDENGLPSTAGPAAGRTTQRRPVGRQHHAVRTISSPTRSVR